MSAATSLDLRASTPVPTGPTHGHIEPAGPVCR